MTRYLVHVRLINSIWVEASSSWDAKDAAYQDMKLRENFDLFDWDCDMEIGEIEDD